MLFCWTTIDWTVWYQETNNNTNVKLADRARIISKNKVQSYSVATQTYSTLFTKGRWILIFHDSVVIYVIIVLSVVRMWFLFSINDVHPDPLSSPGELSSHFLLFSFCFIHDQRTPCFEQLPCINDKFLFN